MKRGVEARVRAAQIVGRVEREGAWSNLLLARVDLPERDARLVRRLVYGTLRNLHRLDRAVADFSDRPLDSIQPRLLDCLRIAFFEVLWSRTPDHALADVAVESARVLGHDRAAGFVNALVRNLQRQGEPSPPRGLAEVYGLPEWAIADLQEAWGLETTEAFLEASHQEAPLSVWVGGDGPAPAGGVETGVAGCFALPGGPVPPDAQVIDPASAAAALAVEVSPTHRVLEVGAAPGGKSAILSAGRPKVLVAVDVHPGRIQRAARRWSEASFAGRWVLADGRRLPFAPGGFDRVLIDAPCTGWGTLRRRPEIRRRVTQQDQTRLAALQRELVVAGLAMLRPNGRLVYSVCTVTPAETTQVVAGLGARPPHVLPGVRLPEGLLMAPHLTGTDAMFIAVLEA